MEHSPPSSRIVFLDVAKGIGILLVVLGHNSVKAFVPGMEKFIFSFHMPFFFLLSGMLFKPEYPLPVLFERRFKTLIRPFLAAVFLLYFVYLFFTEMTLITILRRALRSLYASGNYLEWAQLWFLPHLFLLNLFAALLFLAFYGRLKWVWLRLAFLAAMLAAGIAFLPVLYMKEVSFLGVSLVLDGLPASLDLLPITAAYFLLGYEIRRGISERFFASKWTLLLAGAALVALNFLFPYRLDFFFRTYDSFIVNTLEALAGSLFLLSLAQWIARRPGKLLSLLTYFGQITIVLLTFHQPAQRLTFERMLHLLGNPFAAGGIAFLASMGVPVLIHQLVLKDNPRLAAWFGLRP
ncbi:MAG: hypothetical protein Fur0043_25390 [Anaerolineales bacterium]